MPDLDISNCVYDPEDTLARITYDLARQAYSCLQCTPRGLPGRGFYVWTGAPEMSCCDEVVTWIQRLQTYREVFNPEVYNEPAYNCQDRGWAAEIVISLMRSCRRTVDDRGNPSDAATRNAYGYDTMIDMMTVVGCVEQALTVGELGGKPKGYWAEKFWWRPTWSEDGAHCVRINLPIVVDLGSFCVEEWE